MTKSSLLLANSEVTFPCAQLTPGGILDIKFTLAPGGVVNSKAEEMLNLSDCCPQNEDSRRIQNYDYVASAADLWNNYPFLHYYVIIRNNINSARRSDLT